MATSSASLSIAKLIGFALGGSMIFIILLAVFAGVLILAIIPVYLLPASGDISGDVYRISGLVMQAKFTNVGLNFTGGNVINRGTLANICTQVLRQRNIRDFHSCIVTGLVAFGPSNMTDLPIARKRRDINDANIYEIADISLLFKNPCVAAPRISMNLLSLYFTRRQNSSCVARRTADCQAFVRSTDVWTPLPPAYTQLVVGNGTNCATIAVTRIRNLATFDYMGVAIRFNTSSSSAGSQGSSQVLQNTLIAPGYCSYGMTLTPAQQATYIAQNSDLNIPNTCPTIG